MKKILVAVSIVAILITAVFFYLKSRKSEDFEPLIKAKLQQLVKEASNGLYVLNMDRIEVDIVGSTIKVHNLKLDIDSARLKVLNAQNKAPADVYKITLSDLNIDGFSVNDLLKKKNIDLDSLNIKNPVVEIFHPVSKNNQTSKDTSTLYARIAKSLGHFYVKNFSINDMNLFYHNIEHEEKLTTFKNISVRFKDIEIDSTTQYDTTRFLYAKDALILLNDYSIRTADSLYFIKADSIALHAEKGTLDVTHLALTPRYTKPEFSKRLEFYKDRYDIKFEKASFKNIDWYHLFLGEGFAATKGEFNNGTMEVYADKNIPPAKKSKVGNYPQQLLMRLDFPTDIDTITINNFTFTYRELNTKTQKTGAILFDNINGVISNLTNIKEKIAQNKILKITAHSSLMGKANFDATFTFDLTKTKNGDFTVDANLGPMNGLDLNSATMPLGLFEINSLSIKKLKAHINGTNYNGNGTVLFVYDDLKITALKSDDRQLKKRGFLSFIANSFIINKSNSSSETPQKAAFKRDPQRSFFSLIWKTLLQGITNTVK